MASSAHVQWRNRQARRSTDALHNDPLTGVSAALPRAIVDSPFSPLGPLIQPLLKADLTESRVAGGNQRTLAEFGTEVPRVRVDDDLARVVARAEALTRSEEHTSELQSL